MGINAKVSYNQEANLTDGQAQNAEIRAKWVAEPISEPILTKKWEILL
jgi:hypothetical protein